ncbi:ribonuclease H-like domain-containing protein [Panaeolus papilionaceus]|nr:ribonuclease H-like domain-containing protein [Panaeolus papilionaceus]
MPPHSTVFVDTLDLLNDCLQDISPVGKPAPEELAIDMEGVNLCRDGRVATLQIVANKSTTVWVIDITTLGREAFDHTTADKQSLRAVLQSSASRKLFYDVRNDSDALFSHYGVSLEDVYDIQLLDVAGKRSRGVKVYSLIGLGKCIEDNMTNTEEWIAVKQVGKELFDPKKGGSYEVFEERPISPIILRYCSQDVLLLFELKRILLNKLGGVGGQPSSWKRRIVKASAKRVAESKKEGYQPKGKKKSIALHF